MLKFIIGFVLLFIPMLAQAQIFEKKVLIPKPKENASRYFYVPFEVPENTKSITVSYEYSKATGANVIDLGVFDSTEDEKKGFRGWSGGRRSTIFISENQATNGYIAGKIPAGTWRVILGLYKVKPEGVSARISIKFNEILNLPIETDNLIYSNNPKSEIQNPKWFKGDLHTHTFHSDGWWTAEGILSNAQQNGLDFVAVTDHNTFSHHAEIDRIAPKYKDLLVLRGEEITTYGGHVNVWGLPRDAWIDFRVTPKNTSQMENILTEAKRLNVPASINHPAAFCGGCDWSYGDDWDKFASVEIWNGEWDASDELGLKKWDALLQRGKRINIIGSSDSHTPKNPIGLPTTHIGAKHLTQKDLFNAIYAGKVFITENAQMSVGLSAGKTGIGEILRAESNKKVNFKLNTKGFPTDAKVLIISDGAIIAENPGENFALSFAKNTYLRLEIRDANGKILALTNPIYIQSSK